MKTQFIPIFFFSGTGNTWWVSEQLREGLTKRKFEASTHSIEQVSTVETKALIKRADMVGLGFPIHGSDAPSIFHDFLHGLPQLEMEKPTLGFVTQMIWSGDGFNFLGNELKQKGYRLDWTHEFKMPNNIALPISPLSYTSDYTKFIPQLEKCKKQIEYLCDKIKENEPTKQHSDGFSAAAAWTQRGPFRLVHDLGRKYWSVDPSACISCNRCARLCPAGNITMEDGLPIYSEKCTYCMRCFNYCPTHAIHYMGIKNTRAEKKHPFQGPIKEFKPEMLIKE